MGRKLAVFDNGKLSGIPFPAIPSPIGMPYDYDTGSAGDPGSGEFRFDGSYVYFDDVSAGAVNVETWLATMTGAGALYFCADLEPTQQVGGWVTTGPAQDMTGYWRVPVSGPFGYELVSGDAFARFRFNFVLYGTPGTPGDPGTPGASGRLVGEVKDFDGVFLPDGYLFCDGATLNVDDYKELALVIGIIYGTTATLKSWTAAVTSGSTTVTSSSAHGLAVGDPFLSLANFVADITSPASLGVDVRNKLPFVVVEVMTTTTFRVALAGTTTPVSFTSTSSAQSVYAQFKLSDHRGRASVGRDNMGGTAANRLESLTDDGELLGVGFGSDTHTLAITEIPAHTHSYTGGNTVNRTNTGNATSGVGGNTTGSAGGGQSHNNLQPSVVSNKIICYTAN